MTIARQQLYWLVWYQPATDLAKLLGISGTALKKWCVRFNIPTPGRGYWRKLKTGSVLSPAPLENPEQDFELPLTIGGDQELLSQLIEQAKAAAQANSSLSNRENRTRMRRRPSAQKSDGSSAPRKPSRQGAGSDGEALSIDRSELSPLLPVLTELAERHAKVKEVELLLADIQSSLSRCDYLTGAAIVLWVNQARSELSKQSPIQDVIRYCQRLVAGEYSSS